MKRLQSLTCSCCDQPTKGRQWWNRDKGYGLCGDCAVKIAEKEDAETMKSYYGEAGVHYLLPEKVELEKNVFRSISPMPWRSQYADGFYIEDAEGNGVVDSITDNVHAYENAMMIEAAPSLLITLQDVLEWFKTRRVDGVGYDEESIIAEIEATLLATPFAELSATREEEVQCKYCGSESEDKMVFTDEGEWVCNSCFDTHHNTKKKQ